MRAAEEQLQRLQRELAEEEASGEAARAEAEGALRALKGQVQATRSQLFADNGGAAVPLEVEDEEGGSKPHARMVKAVDVTTQAGGGLVMASASKGTTMNTRCLTTVCLIDSAVQATASDDDDGSQRAAADMQALEAKEAATQAQAQAEAKVAEAQTAHRGLCAEMETMQRALRQLRAEEQHARLQLLQTRQRAESESCRLAALPPPVVVVAEEMAAAPRESLPAEASMASGVGRHWQHLAAAATHVQNELDRLLLLQSAREVPSAVADQLRQRSVALEAVLHYLSAGSSPAAAGTMAVAQDAPYVAAVHASAPPTTTAAPTPAPAPPSLVTVAWPSSEATSRETTTRTPSPLGSLTPPARATEVVRVLPHVDMHDAEPTELVSEAERPLDDHAAAAGSSSPTDVQTVRTHQPRCITASEGPSSGRNDTMTRVEKP